MAEPDWDDLAWRRLLAADPTLDEEGRAANQLLLAFRLIEQAGGLDDLIEAREQADLAIAALPPERVEEWEGRHAAAQARYLIASDTEDLADIEDAIGYLTVHGPELGPESRLSIAVLVSSRYDVTADPVDLDRIVDLCHGVDDLDLSDEDRSLIDYVLGVAHAKRCLLRDLDSDERQADLDRAVRSLSRCLPRLSDDDNESVVDLVGRISHLLLMRYTGGGSEDDRDAAIELLRNTASRDDAATCLLAEALNYRQGDEDLREAAAVLAPMLAGRDLTENVDATELLWLVYSELVARDSDHELVDDAIAFYGAMLDAGMGQDGATAAALVQAHLFRSEPSSVEIDRAIMVLDEQIATGDEETVAGYQCRELRALAVAERALRGGRPDELSAAGTGLVYVAAGVDSADPMLRVLLLALGQVKVRELGGRLDAACLRLVGGFPLDEIVEVVRQLRRWDGGGPELPVARAVLFAFVARTRADELPAEKWRPLLDESIAELRAVLPLADGPLQPLVRQQLGMSLTERGRRVPDLADLTEGIVVLADLVRSVDPAHALRPAALGMLAAGIYNSKFLFDVEPDFADAITALTQAAEEPGQEPELEAAVLMSLGLMEIFTWMRERRAGGFESGLARHRRALAILPADSPLRTDIRYVMAVCLMDRHQIFRDQRDLDVAERHLTEILPAAEQGRSVIGVTAGGIMPIMWHLRLLRVQSNIEDVTLDEIDEIVGGLRKSHAECGTDEDSPWIGRSLGSALMMRFHATGSVADAAEARDLLRPAPAPSNGQVHWESTFGGMLGMLDLASGGRIVTDEQATVEPRFRIEEARSVFLGALDLLARYRVGGDRAYLDRAVDEFERAGELLSESPEVAGARFYEGISLAYWERSGPGDVRRALETGRQAQAQLAYLTLMQTGLHSGLRMAQSAARLALTNAERCLAVSRADKALLAIESGRGLVLHTATASSTIPTMLRELGRPDLAEQWAELPAVETDTLADDEVPSDQRRKVLDVLVASDAGKALLEPPSIAEMTDAVRAIGADALVFLVAEPGFALVLGADGKVANLSLPLLGNDSTVTDYLAALRASEQSDGIQTAERAAWEEALDGLCDWAWRAAVSPLLELVGKREPRLVLVPCGELGVVPWHAARSGTGRFALQQAVFSYAASGRQLCDVAARPTRPVAERPALVCDPSGSLMAAQIEVEFLQRHCYPDATCLGSMPLELPEHGIGTPAEVLAQLPGAGTTGASLLHLSCHATSGPTPARSYLVLADHESLSVAEILAHAHERPANTPGSLVVLAACRSDLVDGGYDEGLTLASAFLVAGATSVIGTRWSVNDVTTAGMMCVFHRALREPGRGAVEALRAAQLWAADPNRTMPEDLPPVLRNRLGKPGPWRLSTWAGLTVHGR